MELILFDVAKARLQETFYIDTGSIISDSRNTLGTFSDFIEPPAHNNKADRRLTKSTGNVGKILAFKPRHHID